LWQFPTVEASDAKPNRNQISSLIGIRIEELREIAQLRHALTHRNYLFNVFATEANGSTRSDQKRKWVRLEELNEYPMSRPQLKIAELLRAFPAGRLKSAGH
jgi:adenine-specific DNA glycosylase